MLIVPASNVSVPLTVVMRTRSNTPPKMLPPDPVTRYVVPSEKLAVSDQTLVAVFTKAITIAPDHVCPGEVAMARNPVEFVARTAEAPLDQ